MRSFVRWTTLAAMLLAAFSVAAVAGRRAQDKPSSETGEAYAGRDLFRLYCAACHGLTAKGDGPIAENLRTRPPDLTLFSQQNGGTFPTEKIRESIDGRHVLRSHGSDMPVWGDAFKASREGSSEESVKARIDALVKHLESIQQRPAQ